uniref:Uncharacterized protein n=2 Tax=Clytia hemisphaerica TaxID=252671 RepID=A0A7M5XNN0_9CNID
FFPSSDGGLSCLHIVKAYSFSWNIMFLVCRLQFVTLLVLILSIVNGVQSNCCPNPGIPKPCPAGQQAVRIPFNVLGCNTPCVNWFCTGVKTAITTTTASQPTNDRVEPTTVTATISTTLSTTPATTVSPSPVTTQSPETTTTTLPVTTDPTTLTTQSTTKTETTTTKPSNTTTQPIVTLPIASNTTSKSTQTVSTQPTTTKQSSTTKSTQNNECERTCWSNQPITNCRQQYNQKIVTLTLKVNKCECQAQKCVATDSCVYNDSLILNHEEFRTDCKQVCVCVKGNLRCVAACSSEEAVIDCSERRSERRPGGRRDGRREHPEKVLARRRLMNEEVSKKCGCEIRKSVRCKRPTTTDDKTSMYLYIGIGIAAVLVFIFIILCFIKFCCMKDRKKDGKESMKCEHQKHQRLSVRVRRTSSWMKTRSLPAAPCDEEGCINSRCPASDNRKLLRSSNKSKGKLHKFQDGTSAKTRYMPSPNTGRKSNESLASTNKAFTFQPANDDEGTYYTQPNMASIPNGGSSSYLSSAGPLSTSIPQGSPLSTSMTGAGSLLSSPIPSHKNSTASIEMYDLNHAVIIDDEIDPENDPTSDNFRGKDRSYSKLSCIQDEISHYQGLDIETQDSKVESTKNIDDDTQSVLYQSLDSPPYQSIEKYQKTSNLEDSNEYLQATDGGSYQDMTSAIDGGNNYQDMSGVYCQPNKMSYPYSKKFLSEDLSFPKGPFNNTGNVLKSDLKSGLPKNNMKELPPNQDSVDSTHYEVSDKQDPDYQNDYVSSYLDLTAPDEELQY